MWQVSVEAPPNTWREQETGDALFSRVAAHDAHTLTATQVPTCARGEHTQQHVTLVLCGGDVVGKLWTVKPARRRAARRYARIGSGSTIFAAKPPTESRKNPPATGTPAAASARARSSAPSAVVGVRVRGEDGVFRKRFRAGECVVPCLPCDDLT